MSAQRPTRAHALFAVFRPHKGSLRRLLLIWVLAPQIMLWLAGGFTMYRLTIRHVNQAADSTLVHATRALARTVKPIGSGLMIDFPNAAQEVLEADPNDRLLWMVSTPPGKLILGNTTLPMPPQQPDRRRDEPYFYDGVITLDDGANGQRTQRVRIAALFLRVSDAPAPAGWMLVQVARSMASRDTLLAGILVEMLLPLSVLIALMTMIVRLGIGAGLKPLNRLRSEVAGRSPENLAPLELDAAPQEVRVLVQALNDLLAAVQQNVNAQQRFIANAAHQLRTPLAGLASQTELALHANQDPALASRLQLVRHSATRMTHLINQLLMLARAEPGAMAAREMVPTDLNDMVHHLVLEFVPAALRADVDLGIDEADGSELAHAVVLANPLLLREAIANVIDNAIAYAGAGSEVTASVRAQAGHALLVIRDTGPGIAPDKLAGVFDRFVRATESGTGCGLGLPIVNEIVQRHQGTVSLDSAAPHGLIVTLRLPLH